MGEEVLTAEKMDRSEGEYMCVGKSARVGVYTCVWAGVCGGYAHTSTHAHTRAHWLLFLPWSEGPTDVPLGSFQLMLRFLSQGRKSWKRKITPSSPLILLN